MVCWLFEVCCRNMSCQLRIQDFPEKGGGANSQTGYANIFLAENCMKMEEFARGVFLVPP